MKLISLRLVNFGKYEDYTLTYLPGITGVVGQNGTGKSTLIDYAQYFAITGEAPLRFNKKDLLRWRTESGHTELLFDVGNIRYTLIRFVQNNKAELIGVDIQTSQQVLNVSDVRTINKKVVELLGMSFDIFREACFVPQGSFIDVINMRHSERLGWLQRITGLKKAEDIRLSLQSAINDLPASSEIIKEMEKARQAEFEAGKVLTSLRLKKRSLKARYKIPDTGISNEERQTFVDILAKSKKSVCDKKKTDLSKEIAELASQKAIYENKLDELSKLDNSLLTEEEAKFLKLDLECQTLKEKILEHSSEHTLAEIEYEETKLLNLQLSAALRNDLKISEVCPVCKQLVLQEPDKVEIPIDIEDRLENLKLAKSKILVRQSLQLKLDNLFAKFPSNLDLVALHAKADKAINTKNTVKEIKTLTTKLTNTENKLIIKQQELQELSSIGSVEDEIYEAAKTRSLELVAYELEEKTLEEELTKAKIVWDERKRVMGEFSESYKQLGKSDDLCALYERAKELLHRDCIPRLVMQRIIAGINEKLSFYLSKFSSEFSAELSSDLDFICDFPSTGDAGKSAITALSGGQKVALALAFRFAIADILGSAIPLVVLDEPTIFLDTANIEAVCEIFKDIRAFAEKGVYVFILTHDEELHKAFTRILEL